LIFFERN